MSKENNTKNPFSVILSRYATEKSTVLEGLKDSESNKSVKRCELPKYVFIVDKTANKIEIASAVENIYSEQNVKVVAVNTINVKPKAKRRRGRPGKTKAFKKAVVTLEKGDTIDNI
jgi:large subunit ribosomal protein L23